MQAFVSDVVKILSSRQPFVIMHVAVGLELEFLI